MSPFFVLICQKLIQFSISFQQQVSYFQIQISFYLIIEHVIFFFPQQEFTLLDDAHYFLICYCIPLIDKDLQALQVYDHKIQQQYLLFNDVLLYVFINCIPNYYYLGLFKVSQYAIIDQYSIKAYVPPFYIYFSFHIVLN